ncbi:FAD-dependent oxidoreductase [Amycolatopsis jiangsuensis]|uniref:2-polyprenyl-6-methoxyphenol hydroxylase-like FAD-dependent oxidoreductase n=1 Tax=Amycolatopsis jiangsuensis TaxID=1181879 RepID=A0A840J7D8_9PSEU|nr:FAD-dependent oxidoreductase [Amycolatopsis jiangsuensis]MBB4689308.1 2-polyprenyl-6-methoxyphenol hydroxylase-like FAD-dependent oxidoreductase [Amycolatopsis jiangsuensis]
MKTCISSAFIVGGGIAGLSAAIALSRAGIRCDVVEIAEAPLGSSIGISGRAAEALAELGVYDAARGLAHVWEVGANVPTVSDAEGRQLSPGPTRPTWPGAIESIGIYRPKLLEIMSEKARRLGATIRRGLTVRDFRFVGDAVVVTTTDGERKRYDLLVGADGIKSTMRASLLPDAPSPAYAGQLSIRWMAPGPALPDEGWFVSPVGQLGFYSHPEGTIYVAAHVDMEEEERLSDEEVHEVYLRLLNSISAPQVVELRKRYTRDAELIATRFESILVPPPWHVERAVLIGDAAHATTAHLGMGGGMALEDSVVLGQCLEGAATLPQALEDFMKRRYERVRTVVETSRQLSRREQENADPAGNQKLMTEAFNVLAKPY